MSDIFDLFRGRYGSRLWFWAAFLTIATPMAVFSGQSTVSDCCAYCRDWFSCFVTLWLTAGLATGGAWACALLVLGWTQRTRLWVHLGTFVVVLSIVAWVILLAV